MASISERTQLSCPVKLKDFWKKQLLGLQKEVKDALEPLIIMLNSMPSGCDAEIPMMTAIRLVCHVFCLKFDAPTRFIINTALTYYYSVLTKIQQFILLT